MCGDSDPWMEFDDLLQSLPFFDPLELNLSVDVFKEAIKRLKSFAAPGIDEITAFELQTLPDSLLQQLLDVLGQYDQGFPERFMIARTFPLNKSESIPLSSQTRPITVLSQIYRAWGAMICRQILKKWNAILPTRITGLLPTRGSHFAAYQAQAEIEICINKAIPISGVTLDLRKCFNLIDHQAARRLLF